MYDINLKNYWDVLFRNSIFIFGGIGFLFPSLYAFIIVEDYTYFYFMVLPILIILYGVICIIKNLIKIKEIKKLNKVGKLVKNLPFKMEKTDIVENDRRIFRITLDYTLPSGKTITLKGEPRYDFKFSDKDGLVDLVIDCNNPKNYFIDFEINRLSGNLPEDYYELKNNDSKKNNKKNKKSK